MCRFLKFYMWNNPLMESYYYHWILCCNIKTISKMDPFSWWSIIKTLQFCWKIFWSAYQALPLIRNQHSLSRNLWTKLPLQFKFPTGSHNKGQHMAQPQQRATHGAGWGERLLNLRFDWYISVPLKNISDLVFKKIIRIRFSYRKFGLTCRTTHNAKCSYLSACCKLHYLSCHVDLPWMQHVAIKFHSFITSM